MQYFSACAQIFFVCTDLAWHDCSFIYLIFIRTWGSGTENDCIASLTCCVASMAYLNPLWGPTSFAAWNRFHPTRLTLYYNPSRTVPGLKWERHFVKKKNKKKRKMWISLGAEKPRGFLLTPPPWFRPHTPEPPLSLVLVVCLCINQPQLLDTTTDKATGISKPTTQRCQLICSMLLDK